MAAQSSFVFGATADRDATFDGQHDGHHDDNNDRDATSRGDVGTPLNDAHRAGKQAAPRCQSSSRIETLPPELRLRLLLSIPDLQTLRSLVHASPTLHAQYRHSRDRILGAFIGRELDGFLIDAYATHMSRPQELGSPRTNEKIAEFTDTYGNWLSAPESCPDLNSIEPERLRSMAAFYLSVAQPLAHRYCEWALGKFILAILDFVAQTNPRTTAEAVGINDLTPQRSELIRVFRAIYRYETYYNLFGCNEGKREGAPFTEDWTNHLLLYRLEPWEAEAVACIHAFVSDKYEEILDRLKDNLSPPNIRFTLENGVYRYNEPFRLLAEVNDYLEGMLSRGLRTVVQLLATHDDEELIVKVRHCLRPSRHQDSTLQGTLSEDAQSSRRYELDVPPDPRDEMARNRSCMKFTGDAVPPTGPPLGWLQLWGGGYANIYGEYIPKSVQRWGYVMWNKERWDFPIGHRLVEQWCRWPSDDPEVGSMHYSWRPW